MSGIEHGWLLPESITICAGCGYTVWRDHYPCNRCGGLIGRKYVPVDALLAAPMPERESIHKGEEWAERYGEWWHEHVRPHVVGGQ